MSLPDLWKHQKDAFEIAKDMYHYGLFFEVGTGKSRTLLELLRYKYNKEKKILNTLILCPPIVIDNWKKEWVKYTKIDPGKVVLLKGTGKKRLDLLEEAQERGNFIAVLNYESLLNKHMYAALTKWKPDVIVLDESHKIKNPTAKRTKALLLLSPPTKYKYILTGTPTLNTAMDLFTQFKFLDGGTTFGKNFYAFRVKYFYDKNAGMPSQKHFYNWIIKPDSLKIMNRLISAKSSTAKKSECLDLPPYLEEVLEVEMSPQQKKMYNEMKVDFITTINDENVVATMALVKALRLMQLASGFCKTDEDKEYSLTPNPKQEALSELLEQIVPSNKVIVWAVFKNNYLQIAEVCDKLKIPYVEAHGGISAKAKMEAVEEFERGDARVFIGHPGSLGIGINLISASYSIFYSRNFSLEHSIQAEARNYRGGSEIHEKITRIDLVTKDSIDEIVMEKLKNKEAISNKLLASIAKQL